jgi:hypothetical protein
MEDMEKPSVVYVHRVLKIVQAQQSIHFLNIKAKRGTNAIKCSNGLRLKHAAAYI